MVFVINFAPHPTTGQPERKASNAYLLAGQGNFPSMTFRGAEGGRNAVHWLNNLPDGAPERIKRGKEKVVTRAVANAEMKFSGTSERGNTALSELE